jgi:hypothetical protein
MQLSTRSLLAASDLTAKIKVLTELKANSPWRNPVFLSDSQMKDGRGEIAAE